MMKYAEIQGYKVSRLTLGTVAFGLDYGISNAHQKPGASESFAVMTEALDAGINSLDTARAYGNAEELVGDFFASEKAYKNIVITTKFRIRKEHLGHKDRLFREVFDSVRQSLRSLKLSRIPFCLFHMPEDLEVERIAEVLPELLGDLKEQGLIDVPGVSVYHPDQAAWWVNVPEVQALQVPMNIMDHRLAKRGLLRELAAANKALFVRSIFLQGLFFMDPAQLKGNLVPAAPHLVRLQQMAEQAGMSIAQLAFSYIRDLEEVTSIVFGAVTREQVKQNIAFLQSPRLDAETRAAIEQLFDQVPEHILMPGSWKY